MSCEKDEHMYVNFVNHADIPVWVHVGSYSEDPKEDGPIRTDDYVEANSTVQIDNRSGFSWESYLHTSFMMYIFVYDRSLSGKSSSENYIEFSQKHLLREIIYTRDKLNAMNWEIHYYPETNSDNDN